MKIRPKQEIIHIMVGTAGHVSHGKSTLVEMLSGCQMNRLPEEKSRKLTIDLGFAPCTLPGDKMVGIIDVPGHRDFIRNAVAGASSIDIVLLVVAANDGVMPQTEEHIKLVRLLGAKKLMAVISKIDMVEEEMVELVTDDLREFLTKNKMGGAPIIPYSAQTLEGFDAVRDKLEQLIEEGVKRTGTERAFRLNIERTFTLGGHGTVVTGVPLSGSIKAGQEVELLPSGKKSRVRAIQTYRMDSTEATQGACSAINLPEFSLEDVSRGMSISTPGVYNSCKALLAQIENASQITFKRNTELRLHCGTAASNASMRLLGEVGKLAPNEVGFAEFRLEEPISLAAGDSLIVRSHSPSDTIAGGTVLSLSPGKLRRSSASLTRRMQLAASELQNNPELGPVSASIIAGGETVLSRAKLIKLTQLEPNRTDDINELIKQLIERKIVFSLANESFVVATRIDELIKFASGELERYHQNNKYVFGMKPSTLAQKFDITGKAANKFITLLATESEQIIVRHGAVALKNFAPALSEKQIKSREALIAKVEASGASGLAKGLVAEELGLNAADTKLFLRLLKEEGRAITAGKYIFSKTAVEAHKQLIYEIFKTKNSFDVKDFRDAASIGRNPAISLLEYFDSEGMTRRLGDGRILTKHGGEAKKHSL